MDERLIPQELIELARCDAVTNESMRAYLRGDLTLEEALIRAVVMLAREKQMVLDRFNEHLAQCVTPLRFTK